MEGDRDLKNWRRGDIISDDEKPGTLPEDIEFKLDRLPLFKSKVRWTEGEQLDFYIENWGGLKRAKGI